MLHQAVGMNEEPGYQTINGKINSLYTQKKMLLNQ